MTRAGGSSHAAPTRLTLPHSIRCRRSGLLAAPSRRGTGGTQGACDGVLTLDWNAFVSGKPYHLGAPFSGGETVWVQCIYRDPPVPPTTSMSDALVFSVCP